MTRHEIDGVPVMSDGDGYSVIASGPAAIVFDWDNTLVDSWLTIHDALNAMFTTMGRPVWSLAETKARVRQSLRDSFPALFGADWAAAKALYLENFERMHLDRLRPMPGAASLLESLASPDLPLVLVSNKTGRLLRREVAALGWGRYFRAVIGAGDAAQDKPHRAPVDLALTGTGQAAGPDVWFIGDTGIDMICAVNADCLPVLVQAGDPGADLAVECADAAPALVFSDCLDLAKALAPRLAMRRAAMT